MRLGCWCIGSGGRGGIGNQRRRYGLDSDLFGTGLGHDGPRACLILWRNGPWEECAEYNDAQLHFPVRGECRVGALGVQGP